MSNLCGAWALSGGPIGEALSGSDKNAMLARLPGGPGGVSQFSSGPVWMSASAGSLTHDGRSCMAVEGLLAFEDNGPGSLSELFELRKAEPSKLSERRRFGRIEPTTCGEFDTSYEVCLNGHYALAFADTVRKTLTLLRDPFEGEPLFYALSKGLLLFSASPLPLLAHSGVPRALDPDTATEFLLNGSIIFNSRTLIAGVHQVQRELRVSRGEISQRRHWKRLLEPPKEDAGDTPDRFRDSLLHAVKLAIGPDQQAAVALSGGLDSAAIAACAVEALGPKNVHAFTHEFQDPSHRSEARHAEEVCRHLGIRHHVVKITYQDYLDAIPEAAWRTTSPNFIVPSQDQSMARIFREHGFAKMLSGEGMEQILGIRMHGDYLDRAAKVLPWVPCPDRTLRFWKLAIAPKKDWHRWLRALAGGIHPGLKPPPAKLYYLILCVLQYNGMIEDAAAFYPPSLREPVRRAVDSPHVRETIEELEGLPLGVQLLYLDYACIFRPMVLLARPMTRAIGASRVAPAVFLNSRRIPANFWPGPRPCKVLLHKTLLQEAMKDLIPGSVLHRPKGPEAGFHTFISGSWVSEIMRFMEPVVARSRDHMKANYFQEFESARNDLDESLARAPAAFLRAEIDNRSQLALWHRCHIELPPRTTPPNWADLR